VLLLVAEPPVVMPGGGWLVNGGSWGKRVLAGISYICKSLLQEVKTSFILKHLP